MQRRASRTVLLCLMLSTATGLCGAAPVAHVQLDQVLQRLQAASTAAQSTQIVTAVDASPALAAQLDALAAAGRLTDIAVVAPAALKAPGPFQAYISGTRLVISSAMFALLAPQRLFDVVRPDDVLPDNLVFVLGHLAFHLDRVDAMAAAHADVARQIAALAKLPGAHDYTAIAKQGVQARIDDEASADIQGWNDVVDAVTAANAGRPPTAAQAASMLMNLRYRGVFFKALQGPDHIHLSDGGNIAPEAANIKALATALATSTLADIE